ncbi:MAG: hypothetical protein IPK78_20435 [Rhodospirillales bacterium]|nr:hypothetical protein [Rhodospirillales bacterium]
MKRMLRWVVVALPLLQVASPALARLAQPDELAIERLDAIRAQLLRLDGEAVPNHEEQTAQWYNFPNWGNWPNWPNWRNFWRNW